MIAVIHRVTLQQPVDPKRGEILTAADGEQLEVTNTEPGGFVYAMDGGGTTFRGRRAASSKELRLERQ